MIYIVKSTTEDYEYINEKAFLSKDKAKEYIKELELNKDLEFATPEFEKAFSEIYYNTPDWEDIPNYRDNKEAYLKYVEEHTKEDNKIVLEYLHEKGFSITEQMLNDYLDRNFNKRIDYEIEELELCE